MNTRLLKTFFTATTLFLYGISLTAHADDTDIYVNPAVPTASEPLVMFTLDYRANMGSTECNVTNNNLASIMSACGWSSTFAQVLIDLGFEDDGRIDTFDKIRGVLKLVLDPLEGVKVGLMMPHENTTAGGGCAKGGAQCSNGAMVMMGFRSLVSGDTNKTKERFQKILRKIPATDQVAGLPDYHPYQLKEMYFEFFRYLTGQDVHYGHQGWRDYNDENANPAKSTNLDAPEAVAAALSAADPQLDFYPGWDATASNTAPSADDPDPVPVETVNHQTYVSPLSSINDCAKIFAINIGFGTTNGDDDTNTQIAQSFANGGMALSLSGSNTQAQVIEFMNDVDLAAETSAGSGVPIWSNVGILDGVQNVVSYFIMESANNTQNQWAAAGGTGSALELGTDPDVLIETLTNIFESILSVSTTFVAPSVPVNVFNRSQTEDDVFLAVFKADENSLPFWPGNIKRLKLADITLPSGAASFELQDQNNVSAIDTDGRIKLSALTLWTDPGDTDMDGVIDDEANDGVDGRAVERGGAGQQIPGFLPVTTGDPGVLNTSNANARQMFTTNSLTTPTGLIALNADNTTGTALFTEITKEWSTPPSGANFAASSAADQTRIVDILEYMRGLQSDGVSKRPWMHGDPLHSRPLTINYGARTGYSTTNPDIRILYGTNDGLFHIIKNTNTDGTDSGEEVWAFAPREVMPIWDRLQSNTVADPVHPITVDGSATALIVDHDGDGTIETGDSDKVIVVFGLRRGGKSYYAFDISDPDSPTFLWRISKFVDPVNTDTSALNADFAQFSQTWSKPVAGFKQLDLDGNNTFDDGILDKDGDTVNERVGVFVFGGGYNGDDYGDDLDDDDAAKSFQDDTGIGKDQANRDRANGDPVNPGDNDHTSNTEEGNSIFMVNALTGDLIWKAVRGGTDNAYDSSTFTLTHTELHDSIASEVAAADTTGDGLLDRIYTGDTGGRVWRFDIPGTDRSTWTANILLDAGRHVENNTDNDRRFFNRPDIVQAAIGTDIFDAVLIGSGDRENPLATDTEDTFFMIKDKGINSGNPTTTGLTHSTDVNDQDLADVTDNCLQTDTAANCNLDLTNGWFMDLGLGVTNTGEKNLAPAVVLGGVVFFTTFSPTSSGSCGLSEGTGKQFALNLFDATAAYNYNTANDGSSSYPEDRFDVIESGGIPVEAVPLGNDILLFQGQAGEETIQNTGALTSWRTYWYEKDKD